MSRFDETVVVRRVPRWWSRREWEWQVWRLNDEYEDRWGHRRERRAIVASGWCRTREEAEVRGCDATLEVIGDESG